MSDIVDLANKKNLANITEEDLKQLSPDKLVDMKFNLQSLEIEKQRAVTEQQRATTEEQRAAIEEQKVATTDKQLFWVF